MSPLLILWSITVGCGSQEPAPAGDGGGSATGGSSDGGGEGSGDDAGDDSGGGDDTGEHTAPTSGPLEVVSLGVGGVALRHGDDLVLTAPLFSNPDLLTVTTGEIAPDAERIEAFADPEVIGGAAAVLVGHAHYDHLLDVPDVAAIAGEPVIYGNLSAANLVASVAEVEVVNDPEDPRVDRRMCAVPDPCTGVSPGLAGEWIAVPEASVRVRPLCSAHPPQILDTFHFGEGCVETPLSAPPQEAADWLEGQTLAWLIDFLDADGAIAHRVYVQDAPASAPASSVHPDLLAERSIDLAVLNVGTYTAARAHPTEALANLEPRFALGVHWEDFFTPQDQPIEPIPFHPDPEDFDALAEAALPAGAAEVTVDGELVEGRYWRPEPQTTFLFPLDGVTEPVAPFALEASTEPAGDTVALRTNLPADPGDCVELAHAPCDDLDGDGLVDAWEDLVLDRLRPSIRFDESELLILDDVVLFAVGRVAPAADGHVRAYIMLGYALDYGRCGVSAHDGDSERVVLDLAFPDGGAPGDVEVVGLYTAAHEGTELDHSMVLQGDELSTAEFPLDAFTGEPRWRVYASDNKHATYPSVDLCEDASFIPCIEEDCDADGVDEPTDYDRLPPVVNAGEESAPRLTDLALIGFPDEDPFADQEFCGGQGRDGTCSSAIRDKLLDDPF